MSRVKPFLHEAVKTTILAELKEYCRSNNYLLKHTSPAELAAFSNKLVCHEVSVTCPLWNSPIRAAAGCDSEKSGKSCQCPSTLFSFLGLISERKKVCPCVQNFCHPATQWGQEPGFHLPQPLGICMSHGATIAKQKEMSKQHDSLVLTWKKDIEAAKKCELLLKEVKEKQIPAPVETNDSSAMEIDEYDLS